MITRTTLITISRLLTVLLLTGFGVAACVTAKGPAFVKQTNITTGKALVYVYRNNLGYHQSAYSPSVLVNDKVVVALPKAGYTKMELNPGRYKIGFRHNAIAGYKPVHINVSVNAGNTYYIRIADPYRIGGGKFIYSSYIRLLPESTALPELSATKYVPVKAMP